MSVEAGPEENAFELDGLTIKPNATLAGAKPSTKVVLRPAVELFARITKRHCALLANERGCDIIIFNHLMICSVTSFNRSFELPVEYLTKETGMDRRAQLRALRNLAKTGAIKVARGSRYGPPQITIPGTSKGGYKAT
jgi:hypothetical protein